MHNQFRFKWAVHPDKADGYLECAQHAITSTLGVAGVVEFRVYRPASGASQVATTDAFADLEAWAAWQTHKDTQKVLGELHTRALNVTIEVWARPRSCPNRYDSGGRGPRL